MSALLRLVQQHTPCLRVVLAAAGGDVASRLGSANLVVFGERHGEPEILAGQLQVGRLYRCLFPLPLPLPVSSASTAACFLCLCNCQFNALPA